MVCPCFGMCFGPQICARHFITLMINFLQLDCFRSYLAVNIGIAIKSSDSENRKLKGYWRRGR